MLYRRADGRYLVITRTSPQRAHAKVRANAFCTRRTIARSHRHRSLKLGYGDFAVGVVPPRPFRQCAPDESIMRSAMLGK